MAKDNVTKKDIDALKDEIAQLQAQLYTLNEACMRDNIRVTYYLDLLVKHGVFSVPELENVKAYIDGQIEAIRKEQQCSKAQ